MTKDRREYLKAWRESHKEQIKAWKEAHKESEKSKMKAWKEANKELEKSKMKAWKEAHKEQWNEYSKSYKKSDVNSNGETKNSIRTKSRAILNKTTYKRPGYEIHHCFGYEDPSKFIYCSIEMHRTIHQYLRDNNIDASSDHWMAIRDLVNDTDEFIYIRC